MQKAVEINLYGVITRSTKTGGSGDGANSNSNCNVKLTASLGPFPQNIGGDRLALKLRTLGT